CLALFVIVDVLGLYRGSVGVGPIDLRSIDLFWIALILWMIVERQREGRVRAADVGQRQLVVFLGALALPLLADGVSGSDGNVVAWLRLAQTFSIVALVPYAVRTPVDGEFVIGAVEF